MFIQVQSLEKNKVVALKEKLIQVCHVNRDGLKSFPLFFNRFASARLCKRSVCDMLSCSANSFDWNQH